MTTVFHEEVIGDAVITLMTSGDYLVNPVNSEQGTEPLFTGSVYIGRELGRLVNLVKTCRTVVKLIRLQRAQVQKRYQYTRELCRGHAITDDLNHLQRSLHVLNILSSRI